MDHLYRELSPDRKFPWLPILSLERNLFNSFARIMYNSIDIFQVCQITQNPPLWKEAFEFVKATHMEANVKSHLYEFEHLLP